VSQALERPDPQPQAGPSCELDSYVDAIDHIGVQLRENGALGLILIDASGLEPIERGYGVDAYRRTREQLHAAILEACNGELAENDLVVSGEIEADQVAIFLFRPRGHDAFYREVLGQIAEAVRTKFAESGSRIVYPYRREAPLLPVGQSLIFHNPGLRERRQVRRAMKAARLDAELNEKIELRKRARQLTDLVLSEDITILYEPIVNTTTREIVGYEALVRGPWDTDLHSPSALFQLAAQAGLVFELDCLCRRAALRGARGLQAGKLLFLNCLPTAIHDPSFRGDALRHTLEDLRLRPSDVVFEISEKESIDNYAIFREARDYYAELGFRIALDDTGVAYGSLQALMELAPDFIKVDLSLIRSIDSDPPRQELLRALHSVAVKLNARIIAEGIETSEELATVQALGIPLGQGYLFGRPAPLRRSL